MKKFIAAVIVVLIAVIATIPLWGSCDLNANACSTWCDIRHFDSDIERASCKAGCAADNAGCLAKESSKAVGDFFKGLEQK